MVALRSTLCLAGWEKASLLSVPSVPTEEGVFFNLLGNAIPSCLLAQGWKQACPKELAPSRAVQGELAVFREPWDVSMERCPDLGPLVQHVIGLAASAWTEGSAG